MFRLLLYTAQRSTLLVFLLWVVLLSGIIVGLWFILYQRRKAKDLRFELKQLDKMKENNIESEFVLKAMRLATWHLDPKTMKMTYDSDFRDKTYRVASYTDGESPYDACKRLTPQDAEHVIQALAALCEGRSEEYHVEYRVMIPHSNRFYWEESFATVSERDVDGNPSSIVGTTMIIDDRKRMEEKLVDARNRAEESDRLKSAFIANMSHEIRTPLNAVVGFTSILPDVTDEAERKSLLNLINENTQKLLVIVDDVVNISKIESGKDEIVMTTFDVNLSLNELVELYRHDVKDGVSLNTEFATDSLAVTTDLNRLMEILKHLLSNAIKFTTQGTVTIGYSTPSSGRLTLWVRDTGKGIAEENLERVFERFYKVDEFIPGAGLGLSICRTMAYSLGGTLTVESKLGKGSTFTVDIPIE